MAQDVDVTADGAPAADPLPQTADLQRLDPRSVPLGRLARWPWVLSPLLGGAPGLVSAAVFGDDVPPLLLVAGVLVTLLVMTALAVYAHFGPQWRYRYTRYRVDAHGIEIRHGHTWRRIVTVPRSRVQHTDVAQGPIERRYGLATLTIYTAGTEHSAVPLAGIAHETALALRDDLLRAGNADAV